MSGPSRGGIFISYRRADAAAMAGRLYDLLVDHFGDDQTFSSTQLEMAAERIVRFRQGHADAIAIVGPGDPG